MLEGPCYGAGAAAGEGDPPSGLSRLARIRLALRLMLVPPPRPLAEVKDALARACPRCVVYASTRSDHVLQVYAGLHALHAAGSIALSWRPFPHPMLGEQPGAGELNGLLVELDGMPVFFDVRDGPGCFPLLEDVALYAKRSFHAGLPAHCVPLGLNYVVHPRPLAAAARLVPPLYRAVSMYASEPQPDLAPRALFLARTWHRAEVPGLDGGAVERLNETRAECVRALRRALGRRFVGGFARSAHALSRYPDCVVPETLSTRRRHYLRLLRGFPVGVATTGLSDSIGWKFAEYVALSRAIACEPLRYELPGPIRAGRNYLEFASPAACVEQVSLLLDDRDLRARMMQRNFEYFREYGSPEAVVARVLHTALLRKSGTATDFRRAELSGNR